MKVVRKAFLDFDKEEKFINDMSKQGYAFAKYSWCKYIFVDAPKGEYIYRIELLKKSPSHEESMKYIDFLNEMGIEFISSYGNWIYLRKKALEGEFDIYSDIESRIKYYLRIKSFNIMLIVLNLFIGFYNLSLSYFLSNEGYFSINSYASILSLSVAVLLITFAFIPLEKKIRKLKKEKNIHE